MEAIQSAISGFILELFGGWFLAEEFCVLICSMLPIIELRGAIPMAAASPLSRPIPTAATAATGAGNLHKHAAP